jgi:hypothetical protein
VIALQLLHTASDASMRLCMVDMSGASGSCFHAVILSVSGYQSDVVAGIAGNLQLLSPHTLTYARHHCTAENTHFASACWSPRAHAEVLAMLCCAQLRERNLSEPTAACSA